MLNEDRVRAFETKLSIAVQLEAQRDKFARICTRMFSLALISVYLRAKS